jgi:arginase family enzyme
MTATRLLGVPFDGGAALGGPREAFSAIGAYLSSNRPDALANFTDVCSLDRDNWSFLDRRRLERAATQLGAGMERPMLIGGCHAVSYYMIEAFRWRHPGLVVVQFDAHSDASRTRGAFISHGNFIRQLHRTGPLRLLSIGVRGDGEKLDDLACDRLSPIGALRGVEWLASHAVLDQRPIYVTIDIDVLDPAHCPGVNFPVGGGLEPEELYAMLAWLLARDIVAVDLVEYVPRIDPEGTALPIIAELVAMTGAALAAKPPRQQAPSRRPAVAARLDWRHLLRMAYPESEPVDLLSRYGLSPLEPNDPLGGLRHRTLFATSARPLRFRDAIVVGGPCLFASGGDPARLTLRELHACVAPLMVAADLNLPSLIYLEDNEGLDVKMQAVEHDDVVRVLRAFILEIAGRLGLSAADITIAPLSSPWVRSALKGWTAAGEPLAESDLFGLYSVDGRSRFPSAEVEAEAICAEYRLSLASYQPEVVGVLADQACKHVLAVEDFDQAKAIFTARDWRKARRGDPFDIVHAAHPPPPNRRGQPMQRGRGSDRLYAATPGPTLRALMSAPPDVVQFYASAWLSDEEDDAVAVTSDILSLFRDALRLCRNDH